MKTTKLTNEIISGDTSIDSYPWLSLLEIVNWKVSELNLVSNKISSSLYYSIILDLTGIIEGFTNQVLDTVLDLRTSVSYTFEELEELENSEFWEDNESSKEEDFNYRLVENLRKKLHNSTWNGYSDAFKIIFGKSIVEKIEAKTWKSISSLFTLRNMIIHGKILTIDYNQIGKSNRYEVVVNNKYSKVYSYLSEMKLIEVGPTGYVELISEKSIKHFIRNTNYYIKQIVNGIENKKEQNEILEICSMDKNLIKILNTNFE